MAPPRVRRTLSFDNVQPVAMAPVAKFVSDATPTFVGTPSVKRDDGPAPFVPCRPLTRQIVCDNVDEVVESLERIVSQPAAERPVRSQSVYNQPKKRSERVLSTGNCQFSMAELFGGIQVPFKNADEKARHKAELAIRHEEECLARYEHEHAESLAQYELEQAKLEAEFEGVVQAGSYGNRLISRKGRGELIRCHGWRYAHEPAGNVASKCCVSILHVCADGIKETILQPTVEVLWFQSMEIPENKKQVIPTLEPGIALVAVETLTPFVRILGWAIDRIKHLHPDRVEDIEEAALAIENKLVSMNVEEYCYNERRRLGLPEVRETIENDSVLDSIPVSTEDLTLEA